MGLACVGSSACRDQAKEGAGPVPVEDDARTLAPAPAAKKGPVQIRNLRAIKGPAPDTLHLSYDRDPGFAVPMAAADRFTSLNHMLPGPLRPTAAWASLHLVLTDGTTTVIDAPRKSFGESRLVFRTADPGIRLVVLDKATDSEKESYGPLQAVYVASTPEARAPLKPTVPFPLTVDGVERGLAPDELASLPEVIDPAKGKKSWALSAFLERAAPKCQPTAVSVRSAKYTAEIAAADIERGYLRFNRRGRYRFALVADKRQEKGVRDVTGIDLRCAPQPAK